jgi:hypothetical protein
VEAEALAEVLDHFGEDEQEWFEEVEVVFEVALGAEGERFGAEAELAAAFAAGELLEFGAFSAEAGGDPERGEGGEFAERADAPLGEAAGELRGAAEQVSAERGEALGFLTGGNDGGGREAAGGGTGGGWCC